MGWKPRPGQADATTRLITALYSHHRVIAFTAPTGAGKSGMAYAAARYVRARAVIATPTKQLQDQYQLFFGLPVLYGRRNYQCVLSVSGTAADAPCLAGSPCLFRSAGQCQYLNARDRVKNRPVIVINHAMLVLAACLRDEALLRPLTIIDECHRFPEVVISSLSINPDGTNRLERELWERTGGSVSELRRELQEAVVLRNASRCAAASRLIGIAAAKKMAPGLFGDNGTIRWQEIFQLLGRTLLMSATIPDDLVRIAGTVVIGPDTVGPEQRPIYWVPVAAVNQGNQAGVASLLANTIAQIVQAATGPIIIHAGTHLLTQELALRLNEMLPGRLVLVAAGTSRTSAVRVARSQGDAVLIGPALMDGIDLPTARCQIVAKVPFPPTGGDTQDGLSQAARMFVQAYGRLCRSPDGGEVYRTFVLDANFRLISHLLPQSVRQAICSIDPANLATLNLV